jgi:hypothetical protein
LRRSVPERESANEIDLPVTFKPIRPGLPNCRRENELIPKVQKHVNVYVEADVLFGAFSK